MIFKNKPNQHDINEVIYVENPLFKELRSRCETVFVDFLNICISIMSCLGNKT